MTETVVWILNAVVLLLFMLVGNLLGQQIVGSDNPIPLSHSLIIATNLFCLYLAFGGLGWLVSSLTEKGGPSEGCSCLSLPF